MGRVLHNDFGSNAGRREGARADLHIRAKVVLLGGQCACKVDNISLKGARIEVDWPIKVGDQGILQRQELNEFFTVEWVNEGRCGISFEEEVSRETVLALRRIAEDYEGHREAGLREIGREWVEGRGGHSTSG